VKLLAVALLFSLTSAAADNAKVTVPADALRKMVEENTELRKEVNSLEEDNDKLFDKLRQIVGQVGTCT